MQDVEFLKFVVENLVKNKEDIVIDKQVDELGVLLTLKVNKEDMGVVIGKGGNIVSAIRSLLKIVGSKTNQKINLKVLD
ncbi:KH domain-containing protein [Candidatus Gracilibacteria bacterium]|nr:KH domain-containing protein [Candidatus Gracilibacteria bacterium]